MGEEGEGWREELGGMRRLILCASRIGIWQQGFVSAFDFVMSRWTRTDIVILPLHAYEVNIDVCAITNLSWVPYYVSL